MIGYLEKKFWKQILCVKKCDIGILKIEMDKSRIDGRRFRCSECGQHFTIRNLSILACFKITLPEIYRCMFYNYCNNVTLSDTK